MLSINEFTDQNVKENGGEPASNDDIKFRIKAGIFLSTVMGMSMLFGFGTTLAFARRKDPMFFNRGIIARSGMAESGSSLAVRALGWGTLYSVTGCGLLFYGIWKLLGVNDLQEFRLKMGTWLPRIPKNGHSQGRTEFASMRDLLHYIVSEDEKQKSLQSAESQSNCDE